MTRVLPGVYISLNDYSTIPEGQNNLSVGYVLKANRGPIGQCELVTSPTEFLTKYTFSGSPSTKDDPTFWSILQVLRQTNQVYVVRVAKDAKFGGLVVKKEKAISGKVIKTIKATYTKEEDITTYTDGGKIRISGDASASIAKDDIIRLNGNKKLEGRYKVESCTYVPESGQDGYTEVVCAITQKTSYVMMMYDFTATESDDVKAFKTVAPVTLSAGGVPADPKTYTFDEDNDLFLITGVDEGAYNNDIAITIQSYLESPDQVNEAGTFLVSVYDANTGALLEDQFMCTRTEGSKALNGTPTYIETVLENSNYIRAYNNTKLSSDILPDNVYLTVENNKITAPKLGGGSNGSTCDVYDRIKALDVYADKTIPVSILANGADEDTEADNKLYQQQLIDIAETRKDCVAFLSSFLKNEGAKLNSDKASNVIDYKKGLGSTSFYATMYAPHVNYPDVFNSRTVKLGADATAIAGWLNVIANQGYPFAYAGPTYGLVSGVTTDWKIGDTSGEATQLNNASVNYIAYDAKVGRYYMQTQNTLQTANSALRNLGAVLNVLDIKETFAVYFKEYLQRPITSSLRAEILLRGNDQMKLMLSQGRVTDYSFVDASTDADIADNTLRYVLTLALTPYAQKIYLVMNIVNQSFDFSILQSA